MDADLTNDLFLFIVGIIIVNLIKELFDQYFVSKYVIKRHAVSG